MPKITIKHVAKLKAGDPYLWDAEPRGFGVRPSRQDNADTGKPDLTYVLVYRPGEGGRSAPKRWFTIGRHGDPWTLDKARAEARRIRSLVAEGKDPALERRIARQREGETIAELVPLFIEHLKTQGSRKKVVFRSWREVERALTAYLCGDLGKERPVDVSLRDLQRLLRGVGKTGRVMSNRLASHVRQFFEWCVAERAVEDSPARLLKPLYKNPAARDRTLVRADERGELFWGELLEIWVASETLGSPWEGVIKMLTLTAQRRSEVTGMEWAEIDWKAALWRIPAHRAKNDRPHDVPLSATALAVLKGVGRVEGCPYVFTTGRIGRPRAGEEKARFRPVHLGAKVKTALDRAIAAAKSDADPEAEEMPHWTWHDIRRSATTGMAELGVAPHVADALLNHKEATVRGVAAVYNRAVYPADKRRALDLWAERLGAALAGREPSAKVVSLSA
jgi:integrase